MNIHNAFEVYTSKKVKCLCYLDKKWITSRLPGCVEEELGGRKHKSQCSLAGNLPEFLITPLKVTLKSKLT